MWILSKDEVEIVTIGNCYDTEQNDYRICPLEKKSASAT